ncbi:MAG: UDP-glucose 6-dehydrogenase TuaD [Candidatus Anoxychlamydiales bacterium]|nr:UDP-glucose 6-dehydrogenase TuaD [Candidatus Anoxychlamydiales bacterium]
MKILILGTGYVGLVTGACFSEMGHLVTCLDIDEDKINKLNDGIIPIYEPGLEEIVKRNKKNKRLQFTTDYKKAVEKNDAIFICVPTPSNDDGSCNLSFIKKAAISIAKNLNEYKLIINKSTAQVGTLFEVREIIKKELTSLNKEINFDVASNPEFLKEGCAITDCMKPDRIVIGIDSDKAKNILYDIYSAFNIRKDKIITMDILSSEMTKYAANAMLATRISFMNEIATICKKINANVNNVRKGIGSDSRIGYSFLYPGVGYGGSCFPKDLKALAYIAKKNNVNPKLLNAVEEINNDQKKYLSKNIENYFKNTGGVKDKTIAIWGLSFKPDTDDIREAPSLNLIKDLLKKGATLRVFDPVAMDNIKKYFDKEKNISFCESEIEAANGSHAIALLTEWKQFRLLDFKSILKNLKHKVIFDGRNQYHPIKMKNLGFNYIGIGVPDQIQNEK